MARAFDLLHHDLLFVTPAERAVLAKAGVKARPGWLGSDRLETHILQSEGGPKIAVLLMPPLAATAPAVPQNLIHQVENAVHRLRGTVKLIVAMSSWGYTHEQELLKAPGPPAGHPPGLGTGHRPCGQSGRPGPDRLAAIIFPGQIRAAGRGAGLAGTQFHFQMDGREKYSYDHFRAH